VVGAATRRACDLRQSRAVRCAVMALDTTGRASVDAGKTVSGGDAVPVARPDAESTEEGLTDDERCRRLCHDIGTPAAAIGLLAELALEQDEMPPGVVERLEQITHEAEHIRELCAHVLGRIPDDEAPLHLLAAEAAATARLVHGCPITTQLEPATVRAHAAQLRRLLSNVIDNACRAGGGGGPVTVSVRSTAEGTVLEVADSGPGPGEWALGLSPGTGRPRGSTLGLQIVRSVVDECGGSVRVERAASLRGSMLVVTFPSVPHAETRARR
jgi:signal transduction histidine kinase